MLLALGTLYGTFCAVVFGLILSIPAIGWAAGLPSALDLLRIVSGMLVLTFFIPLYFRVGHTIIRYVLVIGLGLAVAGQVAGMVVVSMRSGTQRSIPLFDTIFGWIRGGGGNVPRNLVIFAIALGIAFISYVASRRIWARREI